MRWLAIGIGVEKGAAFLSFLHSSFYSSFDFSSILEPGVGKREENDRTRGMTHPSKHAITPRPPPVPKKEKKTTQGTPIPSQPQINFHIPRYRGAARSALPPT